MKRIAAVTILIASLFAGHTQAMGAAAITVGIWEADHNCVPGVFGYVRNLDQLVAAIEQKSRVLPVDFSVKLDGDTVKVFDGSRLFVYRFVGDTGLRIVRFSRLQNGRQVRPTRVQRRNPNWQTCL